MLKVILYGFTVGIFSSRKLQRACQENLAFKFLAGMETPVFRTFIEFRQRHRDDMQAVFVQTAQLARELGLARLGAVALDGSKVDANTSKHKAMSYGRMHEEEAKLKAEIKGLLQTANAIDEQEDLEYGPKKDSSKLDRFSYERDQDSFACPHGHVFVFAHEHRTDGTRTYKSLEPVPCMCGHYETVDGRKVIRVGQSHLAKRELRRIMDGPGHSELYRRRKCTVEPVFGQIKAGMGFRRFYYRGRQNVRSEWNLVCATFNLRKMAALLRIPPRKDSAAAMEQAAPKEGLNRRDSELPAFSFLFLSGWMPLWRPLVRQIRLKATSSVSFA